MSEETPWAGRTAVLIGGSAGIGLAVARRATNAGGTVVLGGRNRDRLDDAIEQLGPRASGHCVDTGDHASLARYFERIPQVDHLLVTAASYTTGSVQELSDEEARSPFESKFWGQYNAVKLAIPKLTSDASIVLMSGAAGARPPGPAPAYAACNSALEGLGRGLAIELAPRRVNVVSPGTIDGHLWANRPEDARNGAFEHARSQSLLKRPGTEDEVADAVMFLFENSYLTGSVLYADGGYTLH